MPSRVNFMYGDDRYEYFIDDDATVAKVTVDVKNRYLLGNENGQGDRKLVVLNYLGADLESDWVFSDIGIMPGSTIRVDEREEKMPRLFVRCTFNSSMLKIYDNEEKEIKLDIHKTPISMIRSLVTRMVGLPVGAFRLTNQAGVEMFDSKSLFDYSVELGETILLHTWDGWTNFLNLCFFGYTEHVFNNLVQNDDAVAKYQMKVAMHIACHFGHIDLLLSLMRNGVRADDPVGYHPRRQWCVIDPHVDSLRPPIHEAGEAGQIAILKTLANQDICSIICKDGNDKTPFQVALMAKQKLCAGFLLGKQWSRKAYGNPVNGIFLTLNVYRHMKHWYERARDRNYHENGPSKSTLKRKPYISCDGAIVGLGVLVDGYSTSTMNGRPSELPDPVYEKLAKRSFRILEEDRFIENPSKYFLKEIKTSRLEGKKFSRATISLDQAGKRPSLFLDALAEDGGASVDADRLQRREDTDVSGSIALPRLSESRPGANKHAVVPPIGTAYDGKKTSNSTIKEEEEPTTSAGGLDDPKLPSIGHGRASSVYIETGKEPGQGKSTAPPNNGERDKSRTRSKSDDKQARAVLSAMKKAQNNKTVEHNIPLPLINTESTTKPYSLCVKDPITDPAVSTLMVYESYRGMKPKDYAIKCLSVANNFKKIPWLQQVKLAMNLSRNNVRKLVQEKSDE